MQNPERRDDGTLTTAGAADLLGDVARYPHCYRIPPLIKAALDAHAEHGHEAGGFVEALLRDKLSDAVLRADADSLAAIHDIVTYLNNEMPESSWGSVEKVAEWRKPFVGGDKWTLAEHRSKVARSVREKHG